jgi:hypothetical protein
MRTHQVNVVDKAINIQFIVLSHVVSICIGAVSMYIYVCAYVNSRLPL